MRFWQRRVIAIVCIWVGCVACVPAGLSSQTLNLFFSSDAWGGSPFAESEKKEAFIHALKSKQIQVLTKEVAFEDSSNLVKRFVAVYEVNPIIGIPTIKSGYRLELELPAYPLERITLLNLLTGVRRSIRIGEVTGVN